jgi:adenosylcobinamide kinase/adenosylcobinamide-phosphate guanylyltransferase
MKSGVTLITGGVRSGKSLFAVARADEHAGSRRYLIATGEGLDDEMRERIARHRSSRPADIRTIEEPLALASALSALENHADVVIVDCLTLWISNLLGRGRSDSEILAEADSLVSVLGAVSFGVVIVSDEVGWGIVPEHPVARRFRDLLGWTNQKVAAVAETVLLMVAGYHLRVK